jgi:nucleoside-diphosphate-sugar epimerase
MRALILGCGYLGKRVAAAWRTGGHDVVVLTRTSERADEFAALGYQPIVGDVVRPGTLKALPACDVVLHAIGFDRAGPDAKRTVYVDGLAHSLASPAGESPRWISISSTSVYGQTDGSWVDEDSPCEPTTDGGRICRDAERLLETWRTETGRIATVLRLSGIYGPGRLLARAEHLRNRLPFTGRPDAWLNLIHVEDAVQAVVQAAAMPDPPATLLVSDDRPVHREEYYSLLAHLAAAQTPEFQPQPGDADLNKRCSNRRLRDLGLTLAHPTIHEGLPSAWAASENR